MSFAQVAGPIVEATREIEGLADAENGGALTPHWSSSLRADVRQTGYGSDNKRRLTSRNADRLYKKAMGIPSFSKCLHNPHRLKLPARPSKDVERIEYTTDTKKCAKAAA